MILVAMNHHDCFHMDENALNSYVYKCSYSMQFDMLRHIFWQTATAAKITWFIYQQAHLSPLWTPPTTTWFHRGSKRVRLYKKKKQQQQQQRHQDVNLWLQEVTSGINHPKYVFSLIPEMSFKEYEIPVIHYSC